MMRENRRPGAWPLALGIFSLILGGFLALSEYNELNSGDWFKELFETEMWTAAAIFSVLGLAGIGYGFWVRRRKGNSEHHGSIPEGRERGW